MLLNIKGSTESAFQVEIDPQLTVLDLKLEIETKNQTKPEHQRLIYAGRVLKDEETLATYKLQDGHTLHLVKSKPAGQQSTPATPQTPQPAAQPAPAQPSERTPTTGPLPNLFGGVPGQTPAQAPGFGGMPGFGMPGMGGMPGMPGMGGMGGMQEMLSNPAYLQMMSQMLSNPQMVDMMIASNPQLQNPQVSEMLRSPQFRQMLSNPQFLQMAMSMQGQMGQMGGQYSMPPQQGGQFPPLPLFDPQMMAGVTQNQQPPEERFQTQLRQLQDMGFFDAAQNVRALQMTGGNVEAAIEWLFSQPR
ncbi:putative ubiquitin domain-containing protein [Gorgonomyces haynaldii]|nr:putative ubiquitin domain-containing protein [Gorgonomyces haynaldii]